jgi:hypothetical protein
MALLTSSILRFLIVRRSASPRIFIYFVPTLDYRLLDVAATVSNDIGAQVVESTTSGESTSLCVVDLLFRLVFHSSNYDMRLKVLRMFENWCRTHPRGISHAVDHFLPARLVLLLSQETAPKPQNLIPHIYAMEIVPHEVELAGLPPYPSLEHNVNDKRIRLVSEAVHLLVFIAEHVPNIFEILAHHRHAVSSFALKLATDRLHPQLASIARLAAHLDELILSHGSSPPQQQNS